MKFKLFPLNSLFKEIIKGEYHVSAILDKGKIPLISCKTLDKGVEGYFDIPIDKTYNNCVTIACDGMRPLTSFYHDYKISAKDNVLICIPKESIGISTIFYIIAYLNKMRWRFSYGRKFYANKIKSIEVKLPIKENGSIDEEYIKSKIKMKFKDEFLTKTHKPKIFEMLKLKHFPLIDIVTIERKYAPYINELTIKESGTPYVTTSEGNNGISEFVDLEPNFKKNTITIALDGSCGTAFFQFDDFLAGEKTASLRLKNSTNPYLLFYVGALIRLKSWRYGYGRKLSIERLNKLSIPLPIDKQSNPDLDMVEKIVKNSFGWDSVEKAISPAMRHS